MTTSPNVGVVDDLATLKEAHSWIRLLVQDGLHLDFLDVMGHDKVLDLALRMDELRERTARTGLLQRGGEDEIEQSRRRG